MSIELKEIEQNLDSTKNADVQETSIAVVGVGGGGNNMINHLAKTGMAHKGVKLIIANTDVQHMQRINVEHKIILGVKLTGGKGAGGNPDVGEKAAEESYEYIKDILKGSDMVIISAGLGGGTGSGAAPVIARAAKEIGALTLAVVTKPLKTEGKKRANYAKSSLMKLKENSDSQIVIPNDKLSSMLTKNVSYSEGMRQVDDVLSRAVSGITNIVLGEANEAGINVDFNDIKTVMSHKGLAIMSIGESEGDDAAQEAVRKAIESPLYDNLSIDGLLGAVINFEFNPNFSFNAINTALEIIEGVASKDADINFGTMLRDDIPEKLVRVSIIATGLEDINDDISPSQSENIKDTKNNNKESKGNVLSQSFHGDGIDSDLKRVIYKASNGDVSEEDLDTPTFYRSKRD